MLRGRPTSIATVLAVGALGAGFAAWSGLTGPQVAGVRLEEASENTAASSFTATVDATESVTGTAEVIRVRDATVRETPDRAMQVRTGSVTGIDDDDSYRLTLTQVGGSCWTTEQPPGERPLECEMSRVRIAPLPSADTASGVTDVDGTYSLSPTASKRFISAGIQDPVGMCSVQEGISGFYISWEKLSFNASILGADIEIREIIRFSNYGHVPAVATPIGPPTATAPSSGN